MRWRKILFLFKLILSPGRQLSFSRVYPHSQYDQSYRGITFVGYLEITLGCAQGPPQALAKGLLVAVLRGHLWCWSWPHPRQTPTPCNSPKISHLYAKCLKGKNNSFKSMLRSREPLEPVSVLSPPCTLREVAGRGNILTYTICVSACQSDCQVTGGRKYISLSNSQ